MITFNVIYLFLIFRENFKVGFNDNFFINLEIKYILFCLIIIVTFETFASSILAICYFLLNHDKILEFVFLVSTSLLFITMQFMYTLISTKWVIVKFRHYFNQSEFEKLMKARKYKISLKKRHHDIKNRNHNRNRNREHSISMSISKSFIFNAAKFHIQHKNGSSNNVNLNLNSDRLNTDNLNSNNNDIIGRPTSSPSVESGTPERYTVSMNNLSIGASGISGSGSGSGSSVNSTTMTPMTRMEQAIGSNTVSQSQVSTGGDISINTNVSSSKSKRKLYKLHHCLSNDVTFEIFVSHLSKEFSLDLLMAFIELSQWKILVYKLFDKQLTKQGAWCVNCVRVV